MQKPQWNRIKGFVQHKELSLAMGLHLGANIPLWTDLYPAARRRTPALGTDLHTNRAALLSPIALMIAARKSKRKLVIRLYSVLIGIGLWLIAIFLQVIGGDIFSPTDLLL